MPTSTALRWPNRDEGVSVLGETLRYLQMSGVFYCPSELTEPWGLEIPPMPDCVWFHAVLEGWLHLEIDGGTKRIGPGDLIVVPHGTGHRAWGHIEASTPCVLDLPHEDESDTYAVLRHGGGGERTLVVCGGIRFEHPAARQLVAALPPLIHIDASRSVRADWMSATLQLLAEETSSRRPGSEAVISRLCDIVVIQAIRTWIEQNPAAQTGWLGALHDEQIGRAIARIHTDPGRVWTVASLAAEAAMSRSAFAARFSELVGESAMRYVTRWRMHVALDRLRDSDDSIPVIAAAVGYDSEAAFSRAFKRMMGASPGTMRGRD